MTGNWARARGQWLAKPASAPSGHLLPEEGGRSQSGKHRPLYTQRVALHHHFSFEQSFHSQSKG